MDRLLQEKVRWRCRRGLLELDLVLFDFLKKNPGTQELLDLLDLEDNDLLDIVSGRSDAYDGKFSGIVARLRASWKGGIDGQESQPHPA
jgi:antitoxin CptB